MMGQHEPIDEPRLCHNARQYQIAHFHGLSAQIATQNGANHMNQPNEAKRAFRGLERLVHEEGKTWPPELLALGREATNALQMLDQPGIENVVPMIRQCAAILQRFTDAHAAYMSGRK